MTWLSHILLPILSVLPATALAAPTFVAPPHPAPPEQTAIELLQKAITAGPRTIVVGTPTDNPALAKLLSDRHIDLPHMPAADPQDDSYLALSLDDGQTLVLASSRPRGVLYAACDVEQSANQLANLNIRRVPNFSNRTIVMSSDLSGDIHVAPGPWSDFKDDASPQNFERFLKWCAQHRYNRASGDAHAYFAPMYFVDYSKTNHPEAAQFPPDQIAANVACFRANARLIAAYGMDLIIHNYNLLAPKNYVKAHPELQTEFLDAHSGGLETKNPWVGNLCWNTPEYKQFWIDSYREMFRALPELGGIMFSYAEWNFCKCDKCRARGAVPTAADFISTARQLVQDARGPEGIFVQREWWLMEPKKRALNPATDDHIVFYDPACPKVDISFKSAGYDAATPNPDPWMADFLKHGDGAIAWLRVTDTENTRPLHWSDIAFQHQLITNMQHMGVTGFTIASCQGDPDPNAFIMIDALRNYAWNQPFTEEDAIAELASPYGPAAAHVYRSLEHAAHAMVEYPKLLNGNFDGRDGVAEHSATVGRLWMIGPVLKHVQQNAVGVLEYVDFLKAAPAQRARIAAQWQAEARLTPPPLLDRLTSEADLALSEIRQAKALSPRAYYIDGLVANAVIVNHLAHACRDTVMGGMEFVVTGGDLANLSQPPTHQLLDGSDQTLQDFTRAFHEMATVAKAVDLYMKSPAFNHDSLPETYRYPLADFDAALHTLGRSLGVPRVPALPAEAIWIEAQGFKSQEWSITNSYHTTAFAGEMLTSKKPGTTATATLAVPAAGTYAIYARTLGDEGADLSFTLALTQAGSEKSSGQCGLSRPHKPALSWAKLGEAPLSAGALTLQAATEKAKAVGLDAVALVRLPSDFVPPEALLAAEPTIADVHNLLDAEIVGQAIASVPSAASEAADLESNTLKTESPTLRN